MKKFLLCIGLLLTFNNLVAQKKVIKKYAASGIEDVYVHLKFAHNIVIKNWNKNSVSIEASVNMNDNKHNDYFTLKESNIGKTLTVKSDYGTFFKDHKNNYSKPEKTIIVNNEEYVKKDAYRNYYNNNSVLINYIIYVPNNMKLKVKSISGNVDALTYNGNLTLDLISGDINVKKHSKNMYLKTISGDIDVIISDATFEAKTLTGGIYSDLDIDFSKKHKKSYGNQKISGTIKNGTAWLKLKTISGDIFLRKK